MAGGRCPVFLSISKIKGHQYLYLIESVYVPGRGSVRTIRKSYGRWDKLPEETRRAFEDEKTRRLLEKEMEEQYKRESISSAVKKVSSVMPEEDAAQSSKDGQSIPVLNYGHLALRSIWEKDLDIKNCIYHLQRNMTDIRKWSCNDLLFYLCSRKVMDPASYLEAYLTKENYFYCPWQNISQDNFYRGLDFMYEHCETIMAHAVKSYLGSRGTEVKIAFFDCTNTWFETPYDDKIWQFIRFTRDIRDKLTQEGYSRERIERYLEGEQFRRRLADELGLSDDEMIRMCGPSKDGKFRQPLVLVALAIDQTGLPLDCKVFAGNTAEVNTIETMLNSLKEKYQVKDIYFVADRGLNSTKTLHQIEERGLGFIVAQRVSMQNQACRRDMLSTEGWHNCELADGRIIPSAEPLDLTRFRFKVSNMEKTAMAEHGTGGLTASGRPRHRKLTVKCRVIYTWDPKRAAKDLKELENQVARAQAAIEHGMLIDNPHSTGWRSLIQTAKEAADSDDKELYRAVGLKQDVIAERTRTAGYAAYVYQHPDGTQAELSDNEILSAYHRLIGIEDCFRVMKSRFSLRPLYVRLKEHITAHCCLCFLSLLMLRVLQFKLHEAGHDLSAERVTHALKTAVLTALPQQTEKAKNPNYVVFNLGLNQAVCSAAPACNDPEQLSDMSKILKAVGLRPLPPVCSMQEAKKRLGISRCPPGQLICDTTKRQLELAAGV